MIITSETILERKVTLEKELDEILSKANALSGAIQDCEYWLAILTNKEVEVKETEDEE